MDFEDSRYALFPEPNAYIQRFDNREKKEPKKVVFQEPYETLPNYHINNNFTKHDCDCISNKKNNSQNINNHDFNCNHNNQYGNINKNSSSQSKHDDNCHHDDFNKKNSFGFDLKSLMPLLGLFNKGGGADLSSIVGLLNNANNSHQSLNSANPMNLISSILSNRDAVSGILNMFKGGGFNLFNKKQQVKKELKTTDFEIKNYTRVE